MNNTATGPKAASGPDLVLSRILASDTFQKSPKLSALLGYIAGHSLKGESDLLTEQQIGIAVFGRPPGYNPGYDSIVRVQAHKLREKLAEYFEGPGASEPLIAVIPKGKYGLIFSSRGAGACDRAPAAPPVAEAAPQARPRPWRRSRSAVLAGGLAFGALVLVGAQAFRRAGAPASATQFSTSQAGLNPILQSVFTPPNQTLIVMEDMMLCLVSVLRGRPIRLTEFAGMGETLPDPFAALGDKTVQPGLDELLSKARFVNLANVTFATRLLRAHPRLAAYASFRHPREIQMRDIKSSTSILFGGELSNPWVGLYEDSLNFHLRTPDEGRGFVNRDPRAGEKATYGESDAGDGLAYARIALVPGFDPGARALILTGMSMPETEAAAEFVLDSDLIEKLPRELSRRLAAGAPHVEILLGTTRVGRTVGRVQVIAWRAEGEATAQTAR